MKEICCLVFLIAGVICMPAPACCAETSPGLEGTEYRVYLFCGDSAGDYCDKDAITDDTFVFDDGEFIIERYEDELLGLSASGDYRENGISFTADFEVVTDDVVEKYEFDVQGIALLDRFIAGSVEITYSKLKLTGYDTEDEATAYFFGIRQ
jgi:hypothetical protein